MQKTKIEWADAVYNPVTGCSHAGSPGCDNCYAKRMATRLAGRCGYPADEPFRVTLHPERLEDPLKWKKSKRIFVCSMGDLFHEAVPREFIGTVFDYAYQTHLQNGHIFIFLTKRPARMKDAVERWLNGGMCGAGPFCCEHHNKHEMPSGFWLGVTAENQRCADERIPILLQISAGKRFVSMEPLLSGINIDRYLSTQWRCPKCHEWNYGISFCQVCDKEQWENLDGVILPALDWVIVGGETGPGARPMQIEWARSIRDQCVSASIPFLFKGFGEFSPTSAYRDGQVFMSKVGKRAAGRQLDGRTWEEMPE